MTIDAPGLYPDIPAAAYHADPCPEPSLSSSIAQLLLAQSPKHAWHAHPRLNPFAPRDESRRLDLGTVAHTLLLGRGRDLVEIEARDYRTKAAQEARDLARGAGQTPVLSSDLATARAMVDAAQAQLAGVRGCRQFFDPAHGASEVMLAWQEDGCWCRALIDWLSHTRGALVDYKTVSGSAHPDGLGWRIADQAYDLQAGFYERGLVALEPALAGRITPLFVFQEIDAPYLLTVATLDEVGRDIGREKAARAVALWAQCLARDEWPGYPTTIQPVLYPTFAFKQWSDRQAQDAMARRSYDPVALAGEARLD